MRVRYAGLVLLAARVIGALVGLAFTVIVFRTLTKTEVGAWAWMGRIIGYLLIPAVMMIFWIGRYVARDPSNSRTGLMVNCLLMIPASAIYVLLIPYSASAVESTEFIFLIGAALVPLNYLMLTMCSIGGAAKPQSYGYSEIVFETVKILLAYILVFVSGLALFGAIVAVEVALAMQFAFLMLATRKFFHAGFRKDVAKQWFSNSWLAMYITQGVVLLTFDAVIVVALAGPVVASLLMANFAVATTISALVSVSTGLAMALTPKLLRGGKAADIESVLKLTFLFAIPMLLGSLIVVEPILFLFSTGPTGYFNSFVSTATRVLAVSAFLDIFSGISDSVLLGTADVDKGKPTFKDLARSRLFKLPSLNFLQAGTYLSMLFILLAFLIPSLGIGELTIIWAVILVSVKLPFVLLKFWFSKRVAKFKVPSKTVVKCLIGAIVMAIVLILCLPTVVYAGKLHEFLIYPLILVGIGAVSYMIVMLVVDRDVRQLLKAVFSRSRQRSTSHQLTPN